MLLYPNRSLCRVVVQLSGSIFFRRDIVLAGLFLSLVTIALQVVIDTEQDFAPNLPHHYGMHALGTVVGFAVVFRTTFSWQRYWEAITQLHVMYSKWEDSYAQLLAFASISIEKNADKDTPESRAKNVRLTECCDGALNMFSLLSAYACDQLLHGDNERMHQRLKGRVQWKDLVVTRRQLRVGEDLTGARKLPELNVHRRGSVRYTKDCNDWSAETYNVCVAPPEELRNVLETCSDKCNVVMYWLTHDLATASTDLEIPPPIQSRMYQELSNGMLGLNQAVKIADVPFPFPFAQMLTLLMMFFAMFMPVYVVCFTQSMIVGPIMSFLLFEGVWGLNELAKELETPFGTDINHIPLEDFHQRFVDACQDMHNAHHAKITLCVEPTAGGIRRGNERRPSLAATATIKDLTPRGSPDLQGLALPGAVSPVNGGFYATPRSPRVSEGSEDEELDEADPLPPIKRNSFRKSRTLSHDLLERPGKPPGRTQALLTPPTPSPPGAAPSPRRQSDSFCLSGPMMHGGPGMRHTTGSVSQPLSQPFAHANNSSKEIELLRAMQASTSKAFDDQLRELNERMEQHLGRISADTHMLCEAVRKLCQKPDLPEPNEPLGDPPSLGRISTVDDVSVMSLQAVQALQHTSLKLPLEGRLPSNGGPAS